MAKANKFKKKSKIAETEDSGFGGYQEARGGGTPRGGVWGGKSGRVGWEKREESGELKEGSHREEQPRTDDGKFTYNSVNGKTTKYAGRGETVNPLLTGGENGVKISEVEKQFGEKSGELYEKYKDKWYQKGSEKIARTGKGLRVKISNEDIWEIARRSWDIEKGEFTGESGVFDESKVGRHSEAEKAALAGAKKGKEETYVSDSEGGIAVKKGTDSSERRETRRDIVSYLKGKYGLAPEAMEPSTGERDEEGALKLSESAKKAEAAYPGKAISKLRRPATPDTPATPKVEEKPETPKIEEATKLDEEEIVSHTKNEKPAEITGGTKYGKEATTSAYEQIDKSDIFEDDDKEYIKETLSSGSPEDIDELIDVLANNGWIKI